METKREADKIIDEVHGIEFDRKKLIVERALRSGGRNPTPGKYLGRTRDRGYGGRDYGRRDNGRYDRSPPRYRDRSPRRSYDRSRSRSPRR